jgi:hypothetical protein
MAAKVEFFRVGNGDMTLVTLESGKTLLIDCHIRKKADDPNDDTPDVARQLRDRLKTDSDGRPYVDAMLNSHPDKDHIGGFKTHFHTGPLADYSKNSGKIVVREMWSSPLVFRRASKTHSIGDDAKAWSAEARRRVQKFRDNGWLSDGDRILLMGEDIDGKTDDLGAILVKTDATWNAICGTYDSGFEGLLLAPVKASDDEEDEALSKNNSSVVSRLKIAADGVSDACLFLTGGDAEVLIWEKLWGRYKDKKNLLAYDLLQAPHHCSWHSLSWDSWSQMGEDAKASDDARSALAQARSGAKVVASSNAVKDDNNDPPCIRAKREYQAIVKDGDGQFLCVGDGGPAPLAFDIKAGGLSTAVARAAVAVSAPALIGAARVGHG